MRARLHAISMVHDPAYAVTVEAVTHPGAIMKNLYQKPSRWSAPEPRRLDAPAFAVLLGACALSVAAMFIQAITGAFDQDAQSMAAESPAALVAQAANDSKP